MDGASSSSWSTPPSTGRWTYDVFLSFRGEDTRNNFVDHLYAAFDRAGIYTFMDDEKLQRGKSIAPELIKAIQESMVAVVVFSKNYANSSWCLEELNKIMECHDIMGQKVLPVFYDVDPSDVRGQKRSFETAFQQHEVKFIDDFEKVKKWRETLKTAANLAGWDVRRTASGREAETINQIVRTILSYIGFRPDFHLIGMESHIRHVKELLSKDNVCFVGIWGMGGIGKTTIARVVYRQILYEFEGSSFLEDVRENGSDKRGLKSLQEKLLLEILMQEQFKVKDCDDGMCQIQRRLGRKKVLVVLDDVDNFDQLRFLAGSRDWFGLGSRIIITTRDEHLLCYAQEKYAPELLKETDAMKLFSRYAFMENIPPKEFEELTRVVVSHTGHLPLALKVLGSHFCGRNLDFWQSELKVLAKIPRDEINGILKLSYDGLNIRDLIQEMGRCIGRECYPNTMVWVPEEIQEVMTTISRLEAVEAMVESKYSDRPIARYSAELLKSKTLCFIPSVLSTTSSFDHNINRTTIIELCKISSIVPRGDALPIQVRIIRKWQPYLRKKDTFYLLIDIHGDAIEAIVHHLDNDYFENKIKVNSCYELNDYICDKAALSMKVADHPACLRLGKATSMLPVESPPGFPLHCFNLCSYNNLHSKIGNKNIVTDYAARLDNATPDRTTNGTPVIHLKLTDISGEIIEATIWPEVMPRFDWSTMAEAETPIVLTLTSTSVGMFHGRTNLSSTPATYIYFNAETHAITSLRNRFETDSNQILPPQPRLPNKEEEIQVKSKISDLLQHKLDHGQNKTFTCDILIEKLINGRKWYCQLCPECRRNVYPYKGNWSCVTHHRIVEPKFMYCVGVVVSDTTGSTTATLFDNGVVSLLGMQCKELVIEKGFEAKEIIPEPLQALKNRRATLRLQYTAGFYDFKVNHASIPQSDLQLIDNAPPSTITTTSKVDKPTSSASQQLGANYFLIHRSRQHQEAKELKPNEVVINT